MTDDSQINNDSLESDKQKIIDLFNKNVRGKTPDTSDINAAHDGKGGHWLETQMGIRHNASNTPDIFGFEMKNDTTSKTTFGDWSPKYKIYKKGNEFGIDRTLFLKMFGAPNILKENRHSWSGKPVPKIGSYNSFGQILTVDQENNILALYSYEKDQRANKAHIVPLALQKGLVTLAKWDADRMKLKVENKFNKRGWFKCIKTNGAYSKIVFGAPINFESWIDGVKKGLIFFDSGMYDGNNRPYANWRADNKYWESLEIESH